MTHKRVSLGKTARPRLAGVVARPRLFALLDRGREGSIVWVSGPPGCGKTTLCASYLDQAHVPSLWYQLDEGDGDVATFFYYLGLAAEALADGDGEPLPLLAPEYHAALPVFTRRYFQRLYARLEPPFTVVFDGYQEVPASSQFHEVMREALGQLPPGGSAIVTSRGDPPATLVRLRVNRALAVLGWDELRLTLEETGTIVRERAPGLPRESLEELFARTEGWAAGLVLMLEQAKTAGAIGAAPDLATRQLVFDYLAGEIFQKSDARTREFLLRSAYLTQTTASIARQLTGDDAAARILSGLHRDNYFVTLRHADPETLYQYHPMFRDFLLARAQETHSKDLRRQLQKSSAALMEGAGHPEHALALYRDGHDWDEMARIIGAHAEAMLAQGRGETLRQWIEDLPPEALNRHPWAVYWAAASQAQIAPREARLLYEKAFELFRAPGGRDLTGMILACSGAMDAILYELDDFSLLDRWIAVLDDAATGGVRFPSPSVEARVACSMVFSLTLRQPRRRDIGQWVERALGCAQRAPDPNLRIFVGLLCALTLMWTGVYARALELIEAARRTAAEPGVSPFSSITLKNVEAMFYMLTAQYAPCLQAMREGLEIARATGVHTWTFQLLVYGYGGALGAGNLETAARIAKDLESRAAGCGRLNLCLYHYFQAWEAILRRDLMRALQQGKTALRVAVEVGSPYFEALSRLAVAQVLFECRDERKCIAQLQQVRAIAREIPNRHLEYSCLIGFADMALEHGRPRPGLRALRLGLQIGRQYGYEHFLWWRPQAVARVLAHALQAGIEADYARSLVRRRGLVPDQPPLSVEGWPWAFRVTTFGGFRLLRHDEPLAATGKAQRRPLALLKVLIACGGEQVSEARVTDTLWPRVDGDSAHRSFTSALHRLRKLLGEDRAVVLHEGRLSLDRRYFWVDVWAFERLTADIDAETDAARIEKQADRLLGLYRGPFIGDEVDAAWAIQPRERLRGRFDRAIVKLCRHWIDSGQQERARAFYEKCLEIDALAAPHELFKQSVTNR